MPQEPVTLTAAQWGIVINAYGGTPLPKDAIQQHRQYKLLDRLISTVDGLETAPLTSVGISLSPEQRERLVQAITDRDPPWRLDALPLINAVKEALGWRAPDYGDDEEGDDA